MLGRSSKGRLLAIAHIYSAAGPASAVAWLISAREPTRVERRQYENEPR